MGDYVFKLWSRSDKIHYMIYIKHKEFNYWTSACHLAVLKYSFAWIKIRKRLLWIFCNLWLAGKRHVFDYRLDHIKNKFISYVFCGFSSIRILKAVLYQKIQRGSMTSSILFSRLAGGQMLLVCNFTQRRLKLILENLLLHQ